MDLGGGIALGLDKERWEGSLEQDPRCVVVCGQYRWLSGIQRAEVWSAENSSVV